MKLLYLTFQEDAQLYLGVTRKIGWQASAFERLGYTVTYSLWKDNRFSFITGGQVEEKSFDRGGRVMKQLYGIAESYLKQHSFDVVYVRLDRLAFAIPRLCGLAKKQGAAKVFIEIPNYPYLKDYFRGLKAANSFRRKAVTGAKLVANVLQDRLAGFSLNKSVDAAILIGNRAERFFGVKAMNITNGVDVDAMALVPQKPAGADLTMIAVAGTLWWQAYDRVLEGMSAYQKAHPGGVNMKFLLVGGDAAELPQFRSDVERLGLSEQVECLGFLTGEALEAAYARADLGLCTLGCYRRGLTACSSLKTREYCAKGLPFVHCCEDFVLKERPAFALQIPNDPTPVDMEQVLRFMEQCRKNTGLPQQEREFARARFSWTAILKEVLAFAD